MRCNYCKKPTIMQMFLGDVCIPYHECGSCGIHLYSEIAESVLSKSHTMPSVDHANRTIELYTKYIARRITES